MKIMTCTSRQEPQAGAQAPASTCSNRNATLLSQAPATAIEKY